MPDALMTLFPQTLQQLEALKKPIRMSMDWNDRQSRTLALGFEILENNQRLALDWCNRFSRLHPMATPLRLERLVDLGHHGAQALQDSVKTGLLEILENVHRARAAELALLDLFTDTAFEQNWSPAAAPNRLLLDLPGLRLIDISRDGPHAIGNFTVVFAPRAGHHSNIAERAALFLRDRGLTRMALVEQKCADEIPLEVEGRQHRENFEGQVNQYRAVLQYLSDTAGCPSHLVAVCQPGPLLLTTLILYPHLGRTFGSAGAPMHTEAEPGFLTDFARTVGPAYIDHMLCLFGRRTAADRPGNGRLCYDGRLQVLGFYLLGCDMHIKNVNRLLRDLKSGDQKSADRQMAFYRWYNTVHHFPAGFIRDTFKHIFIHNALINGKLPIGNRQVRVADYPRHIPIWALGGLRDNIAPPLQAVGHLDRIEGLSDGNRLRILCDAGHMGLFRSRKVLETQYSRIADFMLSHSDAPATH